MHRPAIENFTRADALLFGTVFASLSTHLDLRLVSRQAFGSGAVAMRHEPRR